MRSVRIVRNKLCIVIVLLLLFSCRPNDLTGQYWLLDIKGDAKADTVFIADNPHNKYIKDILVYNKNSKQRICSIYPMHDKSFVATMPPIENIYLEANGIQTDRKGLRIIIRNTDFNPDIVFLDVAYDKEWYLKGFGTINSEKATGPLAIDSYEIDKPLQALFGKKLMIKPRELIKFKPD